MLLTWTIANARKGSEHQVEWTRLANKIGRERGLRGQDLANFTSDCRLDNQGKTKE